MDSLLQGAIMSAQLYLANRNDNGLLIQLENRLDSLNAVSQDWALSNTSSTVQWTDENLMLIEWFGYCYNLLATPEPPQLSLSLKLVAFLTNFAWYNVSARHYFQTQLNLPSALSLCVLRHVDDQAHGDFVLLCLKLFQIVTYKSPSLHDLTKVVASADFLFLLLKNVCRRKSDEYIDELRYSLGILNNLCTHSSATREFIKKTDLVKEFYRKILALLQDNNRGVVINCLSLVMVVDDNLKDKMFNSRNLPHTFQCAFNVLVKGDQFMARHYAVDLFVHMIKHSVIQDALAGYPLLEQSLRNVCSLLVNLEARREPLYKVYELLLNFCKLDPLRRTTCSAIMQAGPVDDRLISPLVAVIECARSPIEQSAFPDLPCRAMKLLKYVFEEVVGSGHRLADYISTDVLLRVIEECLKETIETGRPYLAAYKSKRIVNCLRMATTASCEDPEFRNDLLEVITPALCAHLAEFQMLSNPIMSSSTSLKEDQQSGQSDKERWHGIGAQILFSLVEFLKCQEKHSASHREQYRRLLKDARLVPFLAYGIVSQDKKLVDQAFHVTFSMAQEAEFPGAWLSDLVSRNVRSIRQVPSGGTTVREGRFQDGAVPNGIGSKTSVDSGAGSNGSFGYVSVKTFADPAAIDEFIASIKNLNVNDPKTSQIMEVYERKIALMEGKERQLQEVLQARSNALQQSDMLVNQYRLNRKEVEKETAKLRGLLHETELKQEQSTVQLSALSSDIEKLRFRTTQLESLLQERDQEIDAYREVEADYKMKLKSLSEEKETLRREIESEKDMHDVLRKHYDKMKQNFDLTYSKLAEAENDLKQMKKLCKDQETALSNLAEKNEDLKSQLSDKDADLDELEKNFEKLQDTLQSTEKEKKQLQSRLSDSERESSRKTGLIKEQEKTIQKLNEELESYANILQSMHKLSSKAVGGKG